MIAAFETGAAAMGGGVVEVLAELAKEQMAATAAKNI